MKTKIVVFVVIVVVVLVVITVWVAKAEGYSESNCNHYTWIDVPGPLNENAVWVTTDPAVLITRLGSYNLSGRTFIIGHGPFTLGNVLISNTWGCYYTGGYYPSQTRVDEITLGLNPSECVFIGKNGEITVNEPVNGSCVLPVVYRIFLPLILR